MHPFNWGPTISPSGGAIHSFHHPTNLYEPLCVPGRQGHNGITVEQAAIGLQGYPDAFSNTPSLSSLLTTAFWELPSPLQTETEAPKAAVMQPSLDATP